jgi:hypothetical protein
MVSTFTNFTRTLATQWFSEMGVAEPEVKTYLLQHTGKITSVNSAQFDMSLRGQK